MKRCDTLTDLVKMSDCILLHCTLTKENTHIINESLLKLFKPDAFLVNVSRGPLVDEVALVKALMEGWIGGAALDVHEEEPFKLQKKSAERYIQPHLHTSHCLVQ